MEEHCAFGLRTGMLHFARYVDAQHCYQGAEDVGRHHNCNPYDSRHAQRRKVSQHHDSSLGRGALSIEVLLLELCCVHADFFRLADQWAKGRHFFNCCGPTEVTIVNTMHKHELGQELSIGRPIPNTSVYILDGNEELVPFGVSGTMWVGGTCVSRGYVELPDQTKTRYKRDKFKDDGYSLKNHCKTMLTFRAEV